jgi:hypothetical protein
MMKTTIATLARLAPTLALFSCAAPKAPVVEPPSAAKKEAVAEPKESDAPPLPLPDDGIRLPNMETMPTEAEFRATNPDQSSPDAGTGAVIARPPTDPPSRPKPTEGE